ncbi:IS630 family transposase [Streptomyces lunaelactis]|nr:IS630 family transposase [Streptomyces lunaelactis]NUK18205.1 IS630 family transposase [Streptomyces lunaelactis]NUK36689.1 IS630 family transposase [Streptomyces lunaelactis]NUK43740.1 IS630 family transposase [Streptomyces lunaelactis]NUK60190.1 IS630 family transposase [Streptomyces lunaelactis]
MHEERVRAHTTPQRAARRAHIVLLTAGGCPAWRIAEIVRVDVSTVERWRDRYAREGLAGLEDRPRSGRPPVYGPEVRLRIVAAATSTPPHPYDSWSHRLIAGHLADTGISASQIGRILAALQVKPHRVRGWLTRPADPNFFTKAAEVCALYRRCPPDSVVVSVDEKTAMAARSRKHPDRPPVPGRGRRREFEYVRHGTVSVTAALDVHTGQVVVDELPRNDSAHFIRFLARLERCIPAGLTIHLVLDNGASHTSRATRAWLARHPRIVPHYTPKHASWLNQVEIFFSLLARAVLRHGDFTSRADLLQKVTDFAIVHNETARRFRWNYQGRPRQTEHQIAAAAKEPCHAR